LCRDFSLSAEIWEWRFENHLPILPTRKAISARWHCGIIVARVIERCIWLASRMWYWRRPRNSSSAADSHDSRRSISPGRFVLIGSFISSLPVWSGFQSEQVHQAFSLGVKFVPFFLFFCATKWLLAAKLVKPRLDSLKRALIEHQSNRRRNILCNRL